MAKNTFIGYVGTYTRGDSEGIYTFSLDTAEKRLSQTALAAEIENPTYLAITKDNKSLYSVKKDGDLGGVASFEVNPETGDLSYLNHRLLEGPPPCHVSVDKEFATVLATNYHRGSVETFIVDQQDRSLEEAISVVRHEGSGLDPERQEKAHTHYAGFTPDQKFVVAVDLGIDKILTYKLNDGKLTQVHSLTVKAGSGPRHLVFHPNRKWAYVMTELSSEVIVLAYNEKNGSFEEIQYLSTLPEGFTENNQGSAIHISSDGRYLYAGNRGHNSIALFWINQANGQLDFVEHTSTEGNWPRDFVLDPSENFVVASNQESNNLVLFSRDVESGKLTLLQSVPVPEPVCVKFLHA